MEKKNLAAPIVIGAMVAFLLSVIIYIIATLLATNDVNKAISQNVLCYSGGIVIYAGTTTGAVRQGVGHVSFSDARTGTKMTIRNADCMIAE